MPGRVGVEVVVPVYNGRRTLAGCIDALLRQTVLPQLVWVVDNGSTDGTYEWLLERSKEQPRLRVLRELRRGPAAARNAALPGVQAEVVAFTDADCVPEPTWLERLVAGYGDERVGAVAGAVIGHAPRNVVERYQAVAGFPTPREPRVVEAYEFPTVVFYTANLSVRTEVLRQIGGFDEAMPPSDDTDLCSRILRAGWKIAYTPAARVGHVHRSRLCPMVRRLYEYGASRPKLLRKNSEDHFYLVAGRRRWILRGGPTGCVNLTSPEKVCLTLGALSLWTPWFLALLGAYLVRLGLKVARAGRDRGVNARSGWEVAAWAALHVAEFAAVNVGSLLASARHRVICF